MLLKNFNHLDAVMFAPFDFPLRVPRVPGSGPRAPAQHLHTDPRLHLAAGLQEGVEPGPGSWISIWNSLKISNGHGAPVPTSPGDLAPSELIYRVSSPTDSL